MVSIACGRGCRSGRHNTRPLATPTIFFLFSYKIVQKQSPQPVTPDNVSDKLYEDCIVCTALHPLKP